jgi:hypothetical protein
LITCPNLKAEPTVEVSRAVKVAHRNDDVVDTTPFFSTVL